MEEKNAANQLYMADKPKEALTKYSEGINKVEAEGSDVTDEDKKCIHLLYCNRSMVHLDFCMVEEAMCDANCGIDANPEYGKAYARRAAVLIETFRFKDALEDLEKAKELDPALGDGLQESMLRATGKKWVANCYAKKQKELQKKHRGCHYVLVWEDETGEVNEVPVQHPNAGAEKMLKQGFQDACRSGKSAGIFNIYQTLLTMDTPVKKQVGGYDEYKKLLEKQMEREFGQVPKARTPSTIQSSTGSKAKRPVALYTSITTAQDTSKGYPRRFYPGAPKWMNLPEKFLEVAAHDWPQMDRGADFQTAIENITGQRKSDQCYRLLNEAYAEAGGAAVAKMSIAEHKKVYHSCGLSVRTQAPDAMQLTHKDIMNQKVIFQAGPGDHEPTRKASVLVCDECNAVIEDQDDPPECICGEIYCSDACHEAAWEDHESICQSVGASQQGALSITEYYWQLVFKGYFACKNEPDYAAQWKAKGIDDFDQELQFYLGEERDRYANAVGDVQGPFQRAMGGMLNGKKKEEAITDFFDVVLTQATRMTTPLYCDSAARLTFKLSISDVYHRMAADMPPGIMRIPSRVEMSQQFEPLIRQRKAPGWKPSTAPSTSSAGGMGGFAQMGGGGFGGSGATPAAGRGGGGGGGGGKKKKSNTRGRGGAGGSSQNAGGAGGEQMDPAMMAMMMQAMGGRGGGGGGRGGGGRGGGGRGGGGRGGGGMTPEMMQMMMGMMGQGGGGGAGGAGAGAPPHSANPQLGEEDID